MGQACAYALSNEAALRRYCTDGRLAIDNNVSERTLREFVVGRKNWLFFGSPEAAKWSAIVYPFHKRRIQRFLFLVDKGFVVSFFRNPNPTMRKKSPRYDLSVQRRAVEQVIHHHRPIAQVARQLHCSPQSVKNWIDKHKSPISSLTFLPIQVEPTTTSPSGKIELVTRNGLTLRFPFDTPPEALCGIIRQLEHAPC